MRNLLLSILVLFSTVCFAQSKLAGFVTEQNSGKKPVADALIKSGGANQIRSSTTGQFVLTYQDLPAGKNVYVRAEKDGWEVVNEKELNTLIPANPDEKPLKIILCPAGTLATAKSKYYDTFEQNLLKELNRQKALNKGNEKKIVSLEEEFTKLQEQLTELAEEYSRINLDDATEKELKAIQLFNEGKYNEFIELKRSIVTEEQVDKAFKNKVEGNKQIEIGKAKIANSDSTIALYFKSQRDIAKTQILQFDFKGAEKTYENIYLKDTLNLNNIIDFASFLEYQNNYSKAYLYFQSALKFKISNDTIARINSSLGFILYRQHKFQMAFIPTMKAIDILKELNLHKQGEYESRLVRALRNLSHIYHDTNEKEKQLTTLLEAQEILNKSPHAKKSRLYYINSELINLDLGDYYYEKKRYGMAKIKYKYALIILDIISQDSLDKDSTIYLPFKAMAIQKLGSIYTINNQIDSAILFVRKSLLMMDKMVLKNPAKYQEQVASLQNNLGNLHIKLKNYESAIIAYNKSIEIRENIIKENPEIIGEDLAKTYIKLAQANGSRKNKTLSLLAYQKAIDIYEILAINEPTKESNIASIRNEIGAIYGDEEEYQEAYNNFKKSINIYQRLINTNPIDYEVEFCRSIFLLGFLQKVDWHANRQSQVDNYLGRAKQILPKYVADSSAKKLLKDVNDLENYFGEFKFSQPIKDLENQLHKEIKNTKKIKIQEKIIGNYQDLVAQGYPKFTNDLGSNLSNLAWYQLFEKQFSEAEKSAKEALNPINFKKIEDYDTKIEWANTNLALALLFQGKYAEAKKIYVSLKNRPYNKATYRETFLADLEELEKAGVTHPDVVKIRELLKK